MNILTFTSLWPNAGQPNFGVFVQNRLAALAKLDNTKVRVVAPVPYFPKGFQASTFPAHWQQMARVPEQELVAGIETFHPRYLVTPKIGMSFYGAWMARGARETMFRLHREQPIDLIDAHYVYPDGYAAILLGQRLNLPVFLTARGTDINLFSRMPLIRPKIVKALNQATGIIAVSQALKQRMIELGIAAEKIAVIPNGVDREIFHPRSSEEVRRRLSLDLENRIILTVGALVPVKGIDRLIDAIAHLAGREEGPIKLFIIGEGPERAVLESQISNLKLQNRVFLLGARPQTELAAWYAAADLFCLASHREGCPNVVIEALACGLPVVAANVGGVGELLDESCGRVLATADAESLAAPDDEEALATNSDRQKIAEIGRKRSWAAVAEEVLEYFSGRGGH